MEDKENCYKFFEHTADAKFQAYGSDLAEAFTNAAFAMFSIMVDTDSVKPEIMKKIVVDAKDEKSLLYNWLEELLFFLDSETFLLSSVVKMEIKEISAADEEGEMQKMLRVSAVVKGDSADNGYELTGEVKAVTYNEMEIKTEEGKAMVQVVVDL